MPARRGGTGRTLVAFYFAGAAVLVDFTGAAGAADLPVLRDEVMTTNGPMQ